MQMKRTNHNMIDVVSAGPGNEDLLTIQARKILDEAQVVFCARRNENLVASADKRRPLTPFSAALEEMETLRKSGLRIAVLLSGDAGLYSLLPVLEEHFGPDALRVSPGISSLQAFCARLCIPWQESRILSAHGRELLGAFLKTLNSKKDIIDRIFVIDSGVKLLTAGNSLYNEFITLIKEIPVVTACVESIEEYGADDAGLPANCEVLGISDIAKALIDTQGLITLE